MARYTKDVDRKRVWEGMGRIVEGRILNSKLTDIELLGPP